MGAWDNYEAVRNAMGVTRRDMRLQHTQDSIARRMMDSLSCREVLINDVPQTVCIVHTTDYDVKKIMSLPGEHLVHGGLVDFANNKWLITEVDADNIIYERGKMQQCNHILRWINKEGRLIEKWCFVADGTKSGLANSPCLAYRKRYVITTPLIAGTPLEPFGDWAISSQASHEEGSTTIPGTGVHPSGWKRGALTHGERCGMVKI